MVLIQIAAAFAISLGYSIIYNIPKKYILIASAIGAASKLLMFFFLRTEDFGYFFPTLVATIFVTVLSHVCAKVFKTATTIFIAPGIMSFAPGGAAYSCIESFMHRNTDVGWAKLGEVAAVAGAIALGIFVIDLIFNLIGNRKKKLMAKGGQAAE